MFKFAAQKQTFFEKKTNKKCTYISVSFIKQEKNTLLIFGFVPTSRINE